MDRPFQRKGATSNAHVGRSFELRVQEFFSGQGLALAPNVAVPVGIRGEKPHRFDLGNVEQRVLVECKAHTWTDGGNVPSAKMTTWNEAMFLFYVAPDGYRKILCVQRDVSASRRETLGEYYLRTNGHLIPPDVEMWEYDEQAATAARLHWPR